MKRSEVNSIITDIKEFFVKHQFMLPEWADWYQGVFCKTSVYVT